jgi:hypothetical protein
LRRQVVEIFAQADVLADQLRLKASGLWQADRLQ